MKKNEILSLITVSACLLVPAPGRFAYGLIIVVLLNLLCILGPLFRFLLKKLDVTDLEPVLTAVMLVSVTIIYKQVLIFVSPLSALVLGFVLYLTPLSAFVITRMHKPLELSLASQVKNEFFYTGKFSLFALLFFLFRDIVGYGTITLPSFSGLAELVIFEAKGKTSPATFFASTPGALIILAVATMFVSFLYRNLKKVEADNGI